MATVTERHAGGRPKTVRRCPLGVKIERLASHAEMPMDEVAKSAGIANATLYRILTGGIASPRVSTIKGIASALGVRVEKLL
jgi:predicted transcriptional regulator